MKKILLIMIAGISLVACKSDDKEKGTPDSPVDPKLTQQQFDNLQNDTTGKTSIEWIDSTYLILGKEKEGKVIEVGFRYKNSGTRPLVISSVTASCGCTIPETPKEPVLPGQEGVIKATFDSKGRLGSNVKNVTVIANTSPVDTHQLTFSVEVVK